MSRGAAAAAGPAGRCPAVRPGQPSGRAPGSVAVLPGAAQQAEVSPQPPPCAASTASASAFSPARAVRGVAAIDAVAGEAGGRSAPAAVLLMVNSEMG